MLFCPTSLTMDGDKARCPNAKQVGFWRAQTPGEAAPELPELPPNARYMYHANVCYDWGLTNKWGRIWYPDLSSAAQCLRGGLFSRLVDGPTEAVTSVG